MEALYSVTWTLFVPSHTFRSSTDQAGEKKGIAKNKNSQHRTLFACLDFFPIRDRFVTHHAELSSTPPKNIRAATPHSQHNTTHETTTQLATCCFLPAKPTRCLGLRHKGITTFYVAFSGLRSATSAMASSKVDQHQLQIIMPASSESCPMFTTADLRVHQNLGHRTNLETIDSPAVALLQFSDGNELYTTITLSHELAHSHYRAD